jgi:hypothetical protein
VGARRVLVVAHRTARDPSLVDVVAARAASAPAEFTLLVPAVAHGLHRVVDPEDHCCEEAEGVLRAAIPVLSEAAGAPVSGLIGSHDPFAAAWDALNDGGYDEVIVSTHPSRISRWLHLDLPHRIAALGVPVTHVTAVGEHAPVAALERAELVATGDWGMGP